MVGKPGDIEKNQMEMKVEHVMETGYREPLPKS